MKKFFRSIMLSMLFLLATGLSVQAATIVHVLGEIQQITVDDPANVWSGGVIVVNGQNIILPKNLLIDLPANRLTLQQIFAQAPAECVTNGESGLAKGDACNHSGTGGIATLTANRNPNGNVIAGDVLIEKGQEMVSGAVTYIDYTDGYFRVNGIPGDATTGAMVRINDPDSRHTVQQGLGCVAGSPNCSADPRFTLDPDNYTNVFSTGYPLCIPSTTSRAFTHPDTGPATAQAAADGTGDALCPSTNRTAAVAEPPVNDSRFFAPIVLGDSLTAEGNFETINGVHFLSAHTTIVSKALATQNVTTQPDYMFLDEVFMDAPGFNNQRMRAMWIGYTTLAIPATDVDIWGLHRDPITNEAHEFPLASVTGCDAADAPGTCSAQGLGGTAGGNIFRIRYDVDFGLAAAANPPGGAKPKLSPCDHLNNSPRFSALNLCSAIPTLAEQMAIMSPLPKEIQARTGHSIDNPGLVTLDINGAAATNGQYLFPFGMNLGGIETPEFVEIDLNLLNTPIIFEGQPWTLDRRLSPNGCLDTGCEATPQPLDPFPISELDPRTQVDGTLGPLPTGSLAAANYYTNTTLTNVRDRIFSYVADVGTARDAGTGGVGDNFNFNGDTTLAPYPPDTPAAIAIVETPQVALELCGAAVTTPSTATGVTLAPDVAAPQASGTLVTFTATVDPVIGTYEYRFWLKDPVTGWAIVQDFSTAADFPWDTTDLTDGQYFIQVDVRGAGSTGAKDVFAVAGYSISAAGVAVPATGVTLGSDLASPQAAGTPIAFTAVGEGSTAYEYRFWLKDPVTGWAVVRPYSTVDTWNWNPSGVAGAYFIQVDVRGAGTTVVRDAQKVAGFTLN